MVVSLLYLKISFIIISWFVGPGDSRGQAQEQETEGKVGEADDEEIILRPQIGFDQLKVFNPASILASPGKDRGPFVEKLLSAKVQKSELSL